MSIFDKLGIEEGPSTGVKVLIDFSHLSHRNLYVSMAKVQGMKQSMFSGNINLDDYPVMLQDNPLKNAAVVGMFYHLMLRSIMLIRSKFDVKPENIYICLDDRSWRKDAYKGYKAHRAAGREKSEIDFSGFYKCIDLLLEFFALTKINTIKASTAEADDILYVLSEEFSKSSKVIVVTSDKDLKQILRFQGVDMFDPIQREMVKNWNPKMLLSHILLGDAGDGIPSIKDCTEFEPAFLTYCKRQNIFIHEIEVLSKLEMFPYICEEYLAEGGHKASIYKPARFGPKGAEKIIESGNLREELRKSNILKENFKRNRLLIDLRKIPKEVKATILEALNNLPKKSNKSFDITDWLSKYQLKEIQKDIQKILI